MIKVIQLRDDCARQFTSSLLSIIDDGYQKIEMYFLATHYNMTAINCCDLERTL